MEKQRTVTFCPGVHSPFLWHARLVSGVQSLCMNGGSVNKETCHTACSVGATALSWILPALCMVSVTLGTHTFYAAHQVFSAAVVSGTLNRLLLLSPCRNLVSIDTTGDHLSSHSWPGPLSVALSLVQMRHETYGTSPTVFHIL